MKKTPFVFPQGACRFAVAFALCAVSLCAFAGRTSLTESEWNRLARLARGISAGTMVIFR